jgi:hypothetical protein
MCTSVMMHEVFRADSRYSSAEANVSTLKSGSAELRTPAI